MSDGISTTTATIGAAQDACVVQTDGYDSVAFQVGAGLTGTLTAEISVDGVIFSAVQSYGNSSGFASGGALTNPPAQVFVVPIVGGIKTVRLRCSAYTSGSCVVTGNAEGAGAPGLAIVSVASTVALSSAAIASASVTTPFTRHRVLSANTDNPTSVKGSAGNIHYLDVSNDGAAKAFLKLYDKATAPGAGDTPVATILLPIGSNQVIHNEALLRHTFTLGIGYRLVGLIADADNTAVLAAQVAMTILYA